MVLERVRSKPVIRRAPLLKRLGLPRNARWEQAAPAIKDKIVAARRENDLDMAAYWSEAKAFLSRTLFKTCKDCGCAVGKQSVRCQQCVPKFVHPYPDQTNGVWTPERNQRHTELQRARRAQQRMAA